MAPSRWPSRPPPSRSAPPWIRSRLGLPGTGSWTSERAELGNEIARLAARAREAGRLGIDTEFMPEGRYRPLLCLVQICVEDEIVVLDPIDGIGDPAPLAAVLADPDVEVVLHAGRQDVAI